MGEGTGSGPHQNAGTRIEHILGLLSRVDDVFQLLVAAVLLLTAALVFGDLLWTLVTTLQGGETSLIRLSYRLIHDALLVLIILELVWSSLSFFRGHELPLEPFLIVAIIASIRRILFLGVQAVEEVTEAVMLDLALHSAMVLVFSVSLWIIRRSRALAR